MCIEEGFIYIDHENIRYRDLGNDGLHLNDTGSLKLRDNILKCCMTYNPFMR